MTDLLAYDLTISDPIIGYTYIGPNDLVASELSTSEPILDTPSLCVHNLLANPLGLDRPVLNPAAIVSQLYSLAAGAINVRSFTYAFDIIGLEKAFHQDHYLIASELVLGSPELDKPDPTEIPFYIWGIPYDERWGSLVLYTQSTSGERSAADVESERLMGDTGIIAELIIDTWSPYYTLKRNLPFLAWAYNIDLWEDGWSESTQREWVSQAMNFKSIRGTIGAIQVALDYAGRDFVNGVNGYELVDYMVPPQGFYAAPDLTVEEYNDWIRLMPQVRIYLGNDRGEANGDEFYTEDGAIDVNAVSYDDGWELYGRKAILRREGYDDVNLLIIEHETITTDYEAIDWESIHTPGVSELGFFSDEDALEEDKFIDWDEVPAEIYSVNLDRTFSESHTELHLSSVFPGMEPIDIQFERNSDIGDAGPFLYLDDGFVEIDFCEEDYGDLMIADYIYLNDPSVQSVMNLGISFVDIDRIDFPLYTMELLIDLHSSEELDVWYTDVGFVEETFVANEDSSHIDRAIRAVRSSKSLRDKALVAFDPLRPVEAGDYIDEATTAEDWVTNQL